MASRRPTYRDYPPTPEQAEAQTVHLLVVIAVLLVLLAGLTALALLG